MRRRKMRVFSSKRRIDERTAHRGRNAAAPMRTLAAPQWGCGGGNIDLHESPRADVIAGSIMLEDLEVWPRSRRGSRMPAVNLSLD